jgi:hypothetical protein
MNQINWKKINTSDMHDFENTPELIGKYDSMIPANKQARMSSIITLLDEEGKEVKFYGCTIVDNCFENIGQGEMVKVVYKGKRKSKTGAEYKDFDVFHEAQEGEGPNAELSEIQQ